MKNLLQHIEALIFSSEQSITIDEIIECVDTVHDKKLTKVGVQKELDKVKEKYANPEYSFELVEIAKGFQFLTKGQYHNTIKIFIQQRAKRRLSNAALETLSIIAYKQPCSKAEIEHIRGVNCEYSIHKLLEKELISIAGKSDGPGRPILYGTSNEFMDYFGIKSVTELPQLKDFETEENEIGTPAE
ncbi:SMC-Scp complex subunit ScpB [bacterium AH-315-C07]|nr:SMC-Scp complex subunit ScpB [bacterium AH-315-C07]